MSPQMFMKLPEKALRDDLYICGIDEAGRGPLAGPVAAACVHIPLENKNMDFWGSVTDSKKLTAKKREQLFPLIQKYSLTGIAFSSVEEIDKINILQASLMAMERSYFNMIRNAASQKFHALIDGNQSPKRLPCSLETVIKGDSKHLEIAAASILAKVSRDKIMLELHHKFPCYGWNTNSGYGSKKHLLAIEKSGVSPHHRTSFSPIKQALAA